MNTIKYQRKAAKQLSKLPQKVSADIVLACSELKDFPDCQNIKKLSNHQYDYRLRVGNYRVFFDFDGVVRIVYIEEVKKRDENTY